MNASTLISAVAVAAAVTFAGTAFAAETPVANAALSAAAAAQLTVTTQSLNFPTVLVNKSAGRSRAEVRAEAVEAVKNHRATAASQFDWITK